MRKPIMYKFPKHIQLTEKTINVAKFCFYAIMGMASMLFFAIIYSICQ